MATEILPASGTISTANLCSAAGASVLAATSQRTFYPKENLITPRRSELWRAVGTGAQSLDFDLGSAQLPAIFALIDSNLGSGKTVVIQGSDVSGFSTGETYTFTTWSYAQGAGRTLRLYRGGPDSGSATARRYWRVTLPASGTTEADHALGLVWMGAMTALEIDLGLSRKLVDRSQITRLQGGAVWADKLRVAQDIDLSVNYMTRAANHALVDSLASVGASSPVLLDIFGATTDPVDKAAGCLYGYLDQGGISAAYRFASTTDLKLAFTEAVQ